MKIRLLLVALFCLAGTVSHAPASPFCSGALMAQARGETPTMPPPGGNPDHAEPPKGAWCDRSKAVEHHCECHNRCENQPDGSIAQFEDHGNCRANCHINHCRCPWDGCAAPTQR